MTDLAPPLVLIADDDLFFSSRLATGLRSLGYEPRVVRTAEALRARLRERPAAAIVNLASHRLDAARAIREAKDDPNTLAVPLVGFCGHEDVARQTAAREAGCDVVVTNGAISTGLGAVLRSVIAAPRRP